MTGAWWNATHLSAAHVWLLIAARFYANGIISQRYTVQCGQTLLMENKCTHFSKYMMNLGTKLLNAYWTTGQKKVMCNKIAAFLEGISCWIVLSLFEGTSYQHTKKLMEQENFEQECYHMYHVAPGLFVLSPIKCCFEWIGEAKGKFNCFHSS